MATGYLGPDTNKNLIYLEDDRMTVNGALVTQETGKGYTFKNGHFETDMAGWAIYNEHGSANPTIPVTGAFNSGVTLPHVTLVRNTSLPLIEKADGLFTKDAVDRQAEGFSYDFFINKGRKNTYSRFSFVYETSTNYVTGDMGLFVYDVTNAVFIPVTNSLIPSSGGSTVAFSSSFMSTSSSSYRLIFHIRTTNALSYTFRIDDISLVRQDQGIDGLYTPFSIQYNSVTNSLDFNYTGA